MNIAKTCDVGAVSAGDDTSAVLVPIPDTAFRMVLRGGNKADDKFYHVDWAIEEQWVEGDQLVWKPKIHGILKWDGCCQMWPSVKEEDGPMLHFDTFVELMDTLPACFKELWNHCFHDEGALMKWAEFL